MKKIKYGGWKIFIIGEMIISIYLHIFGMHGIYVILSLEKENASIEKKLRSMSIELNKLEYAIKQWKHNDFFIEKFAREKLQMARKSDEIYYIAS